MAAAHFASALLIPPRTTATKPWALTFALEGGRHAVRTTNASRSPSAALKIHSMGIQSIAFSPLGSKFMGEMVRLGIFFSMCGRGWGRVDERSA
jgi:hypothetical protein